jgi:hypothetical protein
MIEVSGFIIAMILVNAAVPFHVVSAFLWIVVRLWSMRLPWGERHFWSDYGFMFFSLIFSVLEG